MIPGVVTGAASVVVEIFSAIGALGKAIGIKGKTQHFSDIEAETIAQEAITKFMPYLKSQYTAEQVARVIPFMVDNYNVLRTRWWPTSRPDRYDTVVLEVQKNQSTGRAYLNFQTIFFQVVYWTWRNVDRDKPDANLKIWAEGIYPVLVPTSFTKAGLSTGPLLYTGGTKPGEVGTPTTPTSPTPASGTSPAPASLGTALGIIALAGAGMYYLGKKL